MNIEDLFSNGRVNSMTRDFSTIPESAHDSVVICTTRSAICARLLKKPDGWYSSAYGTMGTLVDHLYEDKIDVNCVCSYKYYFKIKTIDIDIHDLPGVGRVNISFRETGEVHFVENCIGGTGNKRGYAYLEEITNSGYTIMELFQRTIAENKRVKLYYEQRQ